MTAIKVLLLLLLLPAIASAKPWYKSKSFWTATVVIGVAATVDGVSTDRLLRRCPTCYEMNPLFPRRPSTKRIFLTGAGIIAAERGLIAWGWKKPWVRKVNKVIVGVHLAGHTYFAIHNYRLDKK